MRVWLAGTILVGCGSSASQELVLTGPDAIVVTELGPVSAPTAALSDGTAATGIAWSSSAPSVVAIDSAGAVTALGPGASTVTGEWSGQTVRYDVTVDVPLLLRFVEPPGGLVVGGREGLHVEALLAGKNVDPGELVWASSDPSVATVNEVGQVLGVAPGVAYVTASSGAAEAMLELQVQ